MSLKIMNEVWNMTLPYDKKIILLAFVDYANTNMECWPSLKSIAKKCGMCLRKTKDLVRNLINDGYILSKQRRDKRGHKLTSLYKINIENNKSLGAQYAPRLASYPQLALTKNDEPKVHSMHLGDGYAIITRTSQKKKKRKNSKKENKKKVPAKISLPTELKITAGHIDLAKSFGLDPEIEFNHFVSRSVSRNRKFANWDYAFTDWLQTKKDLNKANKTPTWVTENHKNLMEMCGGVNDPTCPW